MKKKNQTLYALLCAITAMLLAACALEAPPADSGGKGRVIISITRADDSFVPETALSISRTLLPEWAGLHYKLEFTRQGETEPALTQTIATATAEQDFDPGVVYTLKVTAYKTDLAVPSATNIGNYAFGYFTALETLTLPAASSIGTYAFSGCAALTTLSLPLAPPSLVNGPFRDTYSNSPTATLLIRVPSGAVGAYTAAWGVLATATGLQKGD